jgi:hypothetical protein
VRIQVTLDGRAESGGTPLLHHSEVLADPLSPQARAVAEISAKRKKTEADHEEMARREWMGGLYYDETLGPVLPTWNIVRSIQDAARMSRLGKKIERGVFPEVEAVPMQYDGPRDRDQMWASREFAFRKGVKLSGVRVQRTRPIFREWQAEAVLVVDPFVIDYETFALLATQAGRYIGICDFRSGRYGRFLASCQLLSTQAELLDELALFSGVTERTATETAVDSIAGDERRHIERNGRRVKS